MNRTLHVERLFSLGEWRNIRFSDEISDLPADIMFNEELIGKIRYLQLVDVEVAFRKYLELNKSIPSGPEAEMAYLEEVKVDTLAQIKSLLNGHLETRKE